MADVIALGLGIAVALAAFGLCAIVVWVRWAVRDHRRRCDRMHARRRQQDELDRARRRLRLRVENRAASGGDATPLPASSSARPGARSA